jgi:hypothetical protein
MSAPPKAARTLFEQCASEIKRTLSTGELTGL